MTTFFLPDLGEGLPDAEIHEWYVKVGDKLDVDQPMVAMETAKAVVDIPVPFNGVVTQLYGEPGDIIKTGAALIAIEEPTLSEAVSPNLSHDKATVVGCLQISNEILEEEIIQEKKPQIFKPKITPSIRALAKQLNIDLNQCKPTGPNGYITVEDLEQTDPYQTYQHTEEVPLAYEPLRGARRAMAHAMSKSHRTVVPVTLFDEADIHDWSGKTDVTLRLIRAILTACQREPRLNAWYDENKMALYAHPEINLGVAMDTPTGLFVPVLKDIAHSNLASCRQKIDEYKKEIGKGSVTSENMHDATFILSNVGMFAGRFATPIVIPPMVAILAVGRIKESVVAYQGTPAIHKLLPLSLTVDHRAITGGEAARFISELIRDLQRGS